jgi:hypothetical protein
LVRGNVWMGMVWLVGLLLQSQQGLSFDLDCCTSTYLTCQDID